MDSMKAREGQSITKTEGSEKRGRGGPRGARQAAAGWYQPRRRAAGALRGRLNRGLPWEGS